MTQEFKGAALPLDQDGVGEITEHLQIGTAELWAVLTVETRGFGFLPDRRPLILFERHIFSRETESTFDNAHPDISNRSAGGYGRGGAAQYDRLARAIQLDRRAALRSASWGLGQVMGFNAAPAGFADVEEMTKKMVASENAQLMGMANFIRHIRADSALRRHDWTTFARRYNGADFARNRYDIRLATAFSRHNAGFLPDLIIRAAQAYLTYLGFDPGPVDGLLGRLTRSAWREFQERQELPPNDEIDEEAVATLKRVALETIA
ncbi:MAG TPA: N-acetylmuramidase domain-containing protein [Blastocatellia bacterium]|nr:N-acetylmuramidase domain-containing protein [Blastocatellia bacterium]